MAKRLIGAALATTAVLTLSGAGTATADDREYRIRIIGGNSATEE